MRLVHDSQFCLGQISSPDLDIDPHSLYDIPAVLKGIQRRYCDGEVLAQHLLLPQGEDSDACDTSFINATICRLRLDL